MKKTLNSKTGSIAMLVTALICGAFSAQAATQDWVVTKTETHAGGLTIAADKVPAAEKDKTLVMTVNGVETPIKAGSYQGKVVIEVVNGKTEDLVGTGSTGASSPMGGPMPGGPGGAAPGGGAGGPGGPGPGAALGGGEMEGPGDTTASVYKSALFVTRNAVDTGKSAQSALVGGKYDSKSLNGVSITTKSPKFNGITIVNQDFSISNLTTDISADGGNDMSGLGSGVAIFQGSNVNISNSKLFTSGTARSAIFWGSYDSSHPARSTVKDTTIVTKGNNNREPTAVWMLGLYGDVRAVQMIGYYDNIFDNVTIKSAGWAILSVDGVKPATRDALVKTGLTGAWNEAGYYGGRLPHEMLDLYSWSGKNTVKNSDLSILPVAEGGWGDGYGSYSIGASLNVFDNTRISNVTYGSILANEYASASFINGTVVNSNRFGVYSHSNAGGVLNINNSTISSRQATILIKSNSNNGPSVEVNRGKLSNSGDGVLFLLMDNDDPGGGSNFTDESGKVVDQKIDIKDAVAVKDANWDPDKDDNWQQATFMEGGAAYHYNANIHAYFIDEQGDTALNGDFYNARSTGQNLVLHFQNSAINGAISSASTRHFVDIILKSMKMSDANYEKNGVRFGNRNNLGEVKTTATPTVNNGVIVHLQKGSTWTVKSTSYISKLVVSADSKVNGQIKADKTDRGVDGSTIYTGVVASAL